MMIKKAVIFIFILVLFLCSCGDDKENKILIPVLLQSIQITSPAHNQKVYENILIEVDVSNPENFLKVQFFVNNFLIGQDQTPPFEVTWKPSEFSKESSVVLWTRGIGIDGKSVYSEEISCYIDSLVGAPTAVVVYPIENYTDSSVELVWSKTNDNDFSMYIVQYDKNYTSPAFENIVDIDSISDTVLTINGFLENESHIFRVLVEDVYQLKSVSNSVTVTIRNKKPPVLNIATSFRDTSIVEIIWYKTNVLDYNSYKVYRSLDSNLSLSDTLVLTITDINDTTFSDTLSGDSTNYFYLVELVDVGMLSSYTGVFSEFLPSHVLKIVSPVENSHLFEVVEVSVDVDIDNNYTYIKLFNGATEIGQDYTQPYQFVWDAYSYPHGSVQNLRAVGLADNGEEYSSEVVQYVIDSVVGIPLAGNLEPIIQYDDSSATLVWNRCLESDFSSYMVQYSLDSLNANYSFAYEATDLNDTTFTIYNLDENTIYSFRCQIIDLYNLFSNSNSQVITTLNRIPPKVEFVKKYRDTSIIYIEWAQLGIADFSETRIYRSDDSIYSFDDLNLTTYYVSTDTVYIESMDVNSVDYYYFIETIDLDGLTSVSSVNSSFLEINYALSFDGTTCATVPYYSELNIGEHFTLEAWIYQDSSFFGDRIIDRCDLSGTPNFQYSLFADSKLGSTLCSDVTLMGSVHWSNTRPAYSSWHHVAVSYNDGMMTYFIDGVSVSSLSLSQRILCENLAPLSIGRKISFNELYFKGMIDEVRVWNVVRTEQEIFESYQKQLAGNEPGLVVYIDFNEGSGQVLNNRVGLNGYLGDDSIVDSKDPDWGIGPILNFNE